MDKKYEILSVSSLVSVAVDLKGVQENNTNLRINVKIDYKNEKVYFEDAPEGLDTQSLEKQIIDYFKPPAVEFPSVYYDYLSKIKEVRSGDYATSFMNDYKINGENNDSREP
jgi:hypothetical protein